jgi:hypothetical protein
MVEWENELSQILFAALRLLPSVSESGIRRGQTSGVSYQVRQPAFYLLRPSIEEKSAASSPVRQLLSPSSILLFTSDQEVLTPHSKPLLGPAAAPLLVYWYVAPNRPKLPID